MERRAILIGTNRATSDHLQGVDADIKNLYEYLRSDVGGAWEPNEIVCLPAPSADGLGQLLRRYQHDQPDFLFVAFSGHGFENRPGEPCICLNQYENLEVDALQGHAVRQVTIIDACRVLVPGILPEQRIVIGADVGAVEPIYYRKSCRNFFDARLRAVPSGQVLLQSCSSGQSSEDHPNGGLFTHSLLRQARAAASKVAASKQSNWQKCDKWQAISQAFSKAFELTITRSDFEQAPVKQVLNSNDDQLPFLVI